MKILLLSPCKDLNLKKPKYLMIPQLSLHLIRGLTPPEYEVKIIEEEIDNIDLEEECDLVGISCMTSNAPRGYYLAKEFRKRGRKVVMGGIHPTILPDEALCYADSVVVGEVEGVWGQLLEDFRNNRLQKKYQKPYTTFDKYIPLKHRKDTKKRLFNVIPVMTTRGCPYNCDFCCVHDIYGNKIRHVPVENIVRDMVDSKGKIFLFLDDNIIGDPGYAKDLFRAINPLKIRWVGQASISLVKDAQLIKMAAESGCSALFFGLETISKIQLEKMGKSVKDIEKVKEAIKRVEGSGIFFHASMIFGFDSDTKDIFPETLDFLERNRISSVTANILTPYPGTRIYRQFKKEGRLITNDWRYFDHSTAVFTPKNMTPFELQAGRLWVLQEFTKISSIMRRFPFRFNNHFLFHLIMNIGRRKMNKSEMNDFPKLASRLYPMIDDVNIRKRSFSLSPFKLADFIRKD